MVRVVGVRFKTAGKVYYFDPVDLPVEVSHYVVVETARGIEYGEVAIGPKDVTEDQVVQPLKKVLRIGTERDADIAKENKRKETDAFLIGQKKIEAHGLEMNLVDVEYTFDGSKIIFYFTADGRVDFRELVRDLASVFRTRIEMRQIGVRDEAKLLGGIGPCGRVLCCASFLGDFSPVSIRMAKDQNLSLNPTKISGLCGRLMCCLRYEQETYEAAKTDPTLAPDYVPPSVPAEDPAVASVLEGSPDASQTKTGEDSHVTGRLARVDSLPEAVDGNKRSESRTERLAQDPKPKNGRGRKSSQRKTGTRASQGKRKGQRNQSERRGGQRTEQAQRSGQGRQRRGGPSPSREHHGAELERAQPQERRQKGLVHTGSRDKAKSKSQQSRQGQDAARGKIGDPRPRNRNPRGQHKKGGS